MSETKAPTISSTIDEFHLISPTDGHLGNIVRRTYNREDQAAEYQLHLSVGTWPEEAVRTLGHHLLQIVGAESPEAAPEASASA